MPTRDDLPRLVLVKQRLDPRPPSLRGERLKEGVAVSSSSPSRSLLCFRPPGIPPPRKPRQSRQKHVSQGQNRSVFPPSLPSPPFSLLFGAKSSHLTAATTIQPLRPSHAPRTPPPRGLSHRPSPKERSAKDDEEARRHGKRAVRRSLFADDCDQTARQSPKPRPQQQVRQQDRKQMRRNPRKHPHDRVQQRMRPRPQRSDRHNKSSRINPQ